MKTLLTLILTSLLLATANAANVGTAFTYQGELLDNGAPANGTYDFSFDFFTAPTGGTGHLLPPEFLGVQVSKGLFIIENLDFGDIYQNDDQYWIEVYVRVPQFGGGGAWTTLGPRQKLNVTPYASKSNFANSAASASSAAVATTANDLNVSGAAGDVLTYNGANWGAGVSLHVNSNQGTSVGTTQVPPSNGLKVGGDSVFSGDVYQAENKQGLPKYIINAACLNGSTSIATTDLTGNNGQATITSTATTGYCFVTLPTSLVGKVWMPSALNNDGDNVSCSLSGSNVSLLCQYVDKAGNYKFGSYNIIVF